MNDARLRWQCRRGMREVDLLLSHYFETAYPLAAEWQKQAFRALLALPDAELVAYLLGADPAADSAIASIVSSIRNHPRT